jgi:hypothetical protein
MSTWIGSRGQCKPQDSNTETALPSGRPHNIGGTWLSAQFDDATALLNSRMVALPEKWFWAHFDLYGKGVSQELDGLRV